MLFSVFPFKFIYFYVALYLVYDVIINKNKSTDTTSSGEITATHY